MAFDSLQIAARRHGHAVEHWLERERDRLPLWLPVVLGSGIAFWFVIPARSLWIGGLCLGLALALIGLVVGPTRRAGMAMVWCGLAFFTGLALVWIRAEAVSAPVIARTGVVQVTGTVLAIQARPGRDGERLLIAPDAELGLPTRARVSIREDLMPASGVYGTRISVRARLLPPPEAAIPGGYDFARAAWFQQIGATGTALDPPVSIDDAADRSSGLRQRLSHHVRDRLPGSAGGIAAALATGDRAGIALEDEDAMRASGLTHLLSVSGLHITAVVAAAMLLTLRTLALIPALALAVRLPLVAATVGAMAGIGYTLLTGAEVPTVRSCIAALLILAGMAIGRDAMTLRLVGFGALVILLLWPESLVGPSFQLSFAAIVAIMALHEHPRVRRLFARREEGHVRRIVQFVGELLLTGLIVEIALMPIALFHFHKSGLYGALANVIAIPLTTFFIMPCEAIALLLDTIGLGAPAWWLAGQGLDLLLWIAHQVAAAPGAQLAMPTMPVAAFGLLVAGGLWLILWQERIRLAGSVPVIIGGVWAAITPASDLIVTGDGRHLVLRGAEGTPGLLRPRAGDYVRGILGEASGEAGPLSDLELVPGARCGPDICLASIPRDGRVWRIMATRSRHSLEWTTLTRLCAQADIVISDRRMPKGCAPRWLKIDPALLMHTGGISIRFARMKIATVRTPGDDHPWIMARTKASVREKANQ